MFKKRIIGTLLALFCVCFLFAGCGETPAEYDIYVYVNGANYGTVEDVSGTYTEGQDITITAKPKTGHSFFGWVHDNQLVSTEAVYTFKMDEKNSGAYIALFKTPIQEYVYLDNFSYTNNIPLFNGETQQTLKELVISFGSSLQEMVEVYACTEDTLPTIENKTVTSETIYGEENLKPYTFDRTKALYINVYVKYLTELEGTELEYESTTTIIHPATLINEDIKQVTNNNLDIVKNVANENLFLRQSVGEGDVTLYNQISINFKSLAEFPFPEVEEPEE